LYCLCFLIAQRAICPAPESKKKIAKGREKSIRKRKKKKRKKK